MVEQDARGACFEFNVDRRVAEMEAGQDRRYSDCRGAFQGAETELAAGFALCGEGFGVVAQVDDLLGMIAEELPVG